jgi:hypothetical protein
MRITCYYGSHPDMGYIYLKPSAVVTQATEAENEIAEHMNPEKIIIPYITDSNIASSLDQMKIAPITFKDDYEKGYDTEYGNDMDEQGYINGIELTLDLERFIDLIKNQAFKAIQTEWRNRTFHLVTFDHAENVFNLENVIYKMTEDEDAFVIVQLEDPKNLGYDYTNDEDQRRPIALFKALISARDDIYERMKVIL